MFKNYTAFILLFLSLLYPQIVKAEKDRSLQYMKSLEYDVLCQQVYITARNQFDKLYLNHEKSVMLEEGTLKGLPLAIISDIDETILLNYKFQKRLTDSKEKFSYELFNEYIRKKTASTIKGSLEYYKYLASKGIKILYVSNRKYSTEKETYEHLKALGYPIEGKDDLLLQNEKKEWGYNKTTRRKFLTNKYNVIQIFGDSLLDFAASEDLVMKNKNMFGISWFLIPNPFYGNWLK